jgi:MFS family permease
MQDSLPVPARLSWLDVRLVLLLMAVCFLGHFNRISMAAAADLRIMHEFSISKTNMGFVYSAFLIAYTLAMIPCGWLIDRRGPRFTLGVVWFGSATFVALTATVSFVSTGLAALVMLLAIRALMGAFSAPLHPGSATAVGRYLPARQRSKANGFVTGAALVGVAATYPAFGWLIDQIGWPAAFVVMAIITALFGTLWAIYAPRHAAVAMPATSDSVPPVQLAPLPAWARHRNLALLTFSYGAIGYFQYLFFYWVHTYFADVLKVGDERSRNYAAIPPLAMAVGMPLGGWLSDWLQIHYGWRTARVGLGFVTMTTSAVLVWLGVQTSEPIWSLTCLSLALGVLGMVEGPFWATAVEVGGARGGFSAAVVNTGGNGMGLLAPIATPWIADKLELGWEAGIAVAGTVCLAGALCWLGINQSTGVDPEPLEIDFNGSPSPATPAP